MATDDEERTVSESVTRPLVSVITPCFNSERFIRATLESIHDAQDYPNIEHIVIDAGSTDGTAAIVQEYADRLTWISEPDEGQSDAINKGFRLARGEIVAWLNGDDQYTPGAIARAVEALAAEPDACMVYGASIQVDAEDRVVAEPPVPPFDRERLLTEGDFISQPTVFKRRAALEEVGLLRTDLHYCMDYDLWLRLSERFPVVAIDATQARYRLHADSKTTDVPYGMVAERCAIARDHGGDAVAVGLNVLSVKWPQHAAAEFMDGPSAFERRYLGTEYERLPAALRANAADTLSDAFVQAGFRSHDAGRPVLAASWMRAAIRRNPRWFANRGVLSVIFRGLPLRPSRTS